MLLYIEVKMVQEANKIRLIKINRSNTTYVLKGDKVLFIRKRLKGFIIELIKPCLKVFV